MVEKARLVGICASLREKTRTQILQLEMLLEMAEGMIHFLGYFTQGELVQLAGHKLYHVQGAISVLNGDRRPLLVAMDMPKLSRCTLGLNCKRGI